MTMYCTLDEAKLELATYAPTTGTPSMDDRRLLGKIRSVSQRVDQLFPAPPQHWQMFIPTIGTRLVPVTPYNTNWYENSLAFNAFLLALTSVSVNGTTVTDAVAYPDASTPPFKKIRKTDCCLSWYSFCQTLCSYGPLQTSITGVWGFHSDYPHAWAVVDALAVAMTDTTGTTLTVANADGADAYGVTPRFSIGNLIQIDSEWMDVTNVDPATNILTVTRGVNGSTPATHLINAPVSTYQVEPVVKTAVARQAAFQYERRGAFVSVEVQNQGTEVRYPSDWLVEVYGNLNAYANG